MTESILKPQSKPRQLPSTVAQTSLPTNNPSPPPPVNPEKSTTTGGIRRLTIIPTPTSSKNGSNIIPKTGVIPPSIPIRSQQTSSMTNSTSSIPELLLSPVPTVAKHNIIPTRSISNASQFPIMSNLRSSPNNNQTSTSSSIPMVSSTTGNNVTRGGIPRLTKKSHQIVKPTTTTGSAKRPGQTSFSSEHKIDDLQTMLETIHTVAENRLKPSIDIVDSPLYTDKSDTNSTYSLSSSSSSSSLSSNYLALS